VDSPKRVRLVLILVDRFGVVGAELFGATVEVYPEIPAKAG